MENLSGDVNVPNGVHEDGADGCDLATKAEEQPVVGKYIGSSFWSSLTSEVQALKDALEEGGPEEDEPTSPATSTVPGAPADYDLILCPPGSVYVMPGALPEPSPQLSATLCQVFCTNVDRMFKMYHTPSLQAFMIDGKSYLGHDHSTPGNQAVKAAIWFSATNTLSDSQCQLLFGQSKRDQIIQYRKIVDIAMAQAQLMNTNDLATLQAFATYLVSL